MTALEIVDGRGDLMRLEALRPDFAGAVVGIGALGVVTHLELLISPTYQVAQTVHEGLTYADLREHLTEILGAAYLVSIFTRWADEADGSVARVWVKSRSTTPELPGTVLATGPRHVVPGLDPAPCTEQLGVLGPWHERLPTSGSTSSRASARSCRANTWCRPIARRRRSTPSVRSPTGSGRSYR